MNGSSLYYPITIIFISFMYKKSIDWGTQFLMCFITAFVTVGNAPIPSGSFVYLLLVGNAVGIHLPAEAVSLIFAVDPIMDRIITATNVCGDSFAVAIIEVLNKRLNKRRKVKGKQN
ncbi:Excitatory amino acid transporter 2, variant 2 [Bonamia ostreae]|uniref:Amino acid transporter n=1 Tax=Bonamia ostreae TaxID=126728 RepID=A0ABV2ARY8_9EUKA